MNKQIESSTAASMHQLLEMIFGAVQGKAIGMMAELGIADLLKDGATDIKELSIATGTDEVALQRLMHLLVYMNVVSESEEDTYECTELGALLQNREHASLHNYARLTNSNVALEMVGYMRKSLESGHSPFKEIYSIPFYEALQKQPEEAAIFDGAMKEISAQDIPEILDAYDFTSCQSVMDIGGGQGFLLKAVLDKHPQLQASLLELPEVAAGAQEILKQHVDSNRCRIINGNFLETVPAAGDIYILKRVLSHFSDEDAIKLLGNIRQSIQSGGRLLIIDPDTESLYGASFNLLMFLVVGGTGVRTETKLRKLFSETGFSFKRNIPLSTELCIVEALAVS